VQRLGEVWAGDPICVVKVGNRARNPKHAIVPASA
jgi:hypothetical protein